MGERAGVGFKVAILHPLDIPIIESTAMNIDVGKLRKFSPRASWRSLTTLCAGSLSQLAVSTSLVNISREAVTRFSPSDRKCYDVEHDDIRLAHLPYSDDYRYM